jgi:sulfite reductase beta subunit-like hemoprotein
MESHELRDICIAAIDGALVSRGRHKGMIKVKCPPYGTDAAAAWQALAMISNPYKVSIWQIASFSDRQRAIYNNIERALENYDGRGLDRDRVALELMGAW